MHVKFVLTLLEFVGYYPQMTLLDCYYLIEKWHCLVPVFLA